MANQSRENNIFYLNSIKTENISLSQQQNHLYQKILQLKPQIPLYALRPNDIARAANWFLNNFLGKILYSVKSNPDNLVLQKLYESGIRNFDVASLNEIKLIDRLFSQKNKPAKMFFMHPIKSREAIRAAYFDYDIRDFSLDHEDELRKILEVTNNASDLNLHLRLAIPNNHAAIDLSSKFGALPSEASNLAIKIRMAAKKFGICFHVGSQCLEPLEYRSAINMVKEITDKSGIKIDVLDVGGGFPASYPNSQPPALKNYMNEIFAAIKANDFADTEIWCEPGRALVANSGSLVVRIEARKENMLYLNDGTYGGLFDAGHLLFTYPTQTWRFNEKINNLSQKLVPFGLYGPTCDSLDTIKGPFYLPENIAEGDYIEIGNLGAYCNTLRTKFNGFDEVINICVDDISQNSLFNFNEEQQLKTNNEHY